MPVDSLSTDENLRFSFPLNVCRFVKTAIPGALQEAGRVGGIPRKRRKRANTTDGQVNRKGAGIRCRTASASKAI
jgi:hypothetical protein